MVIEVSKRQLDLEVKVIDRTYKRCLRNQATETIIVGGMARDGARSP